MARLRWPLQALVAIAWTATPLPDTVKGLGKYNPCSTPGLATRGMGFYVGIAFWPGGRVEDWLPAYNSETKAFGLNPCNATNDFNKTALSDAQYLTQQGVVVAPFEVAVDTLMSLRINASDIASLFNNISTASDIPDVISAVVFRAGYRSEAVYIRSEDAAVSNGVGYVTTLAIAATFSTGQLQSLQWTDLTCDSCGGPASKQCMVTTTSQPQHSCAVPEADCTMVDCSLSLYMGFSGDDRNSVAFQTGYEISQVNQYSVSTLYNNIVEQVTNVLNNAQTGYVGGGADPTTNKIGAAA